MRTETLLSILRRCITDNRKDYQRDFEKQVLGMIVLTKYNNKTYRISDVRYDISPSTTFQTRDGPISYIDYYKNVSLPDSFCVFFSFFAIQFCLFAFFDSISLCNCNSSALSPPLFAYLFSKIYRIRLDLTNPLQITFTEAWFDYR